MNASLARDEEISPMSIVFFCQSCGSRFDVGPREAGKQGRCKKCGQRMIVPKIDEAAPKAVKPAVVAVGAGAGAPPASAWLAQMTSNVGLAPLTVDRMPAFKKPSMFAEDELADSKPYLLAQPDRRSGGRPVKPVSGVKALWRRQLGMVERIFRWINQTAYLLSVPFIMVLLFAGITHNPHLATMSATAVVLLNVGRLGSGLANLVVIPFRDGMSWKRLKKPVRRLVEPVFTIGLVVAAFAILPSLSKGGTSKGIIQKLQEKVESEQAVARGLEGKSSDKNTPR
jgi:DNA-directed RNA polymerase subunit RPC12/RpoP